MRKHPLWSLALLALLPLGATAQQLKIDKTSVDIGKTGYEMPVTAEFSCRNDGTQPLIINKVKPDCSCTTVEYPQGAIAPGQAFRIRMTYDARQLGRFDKQVAILSNGASKPQYIGMKGLVLADWHDFSKEFPVKMGDLWLDREEIEFDNVNKGERHELLMRIHNDGTRSYQPGLMHLPSWLKAEMKPERLKPGTSGWMTITLDSEHLRDFGLTQGVVYLSRMPGDTVSAERELNAVAVLMPAVTSLTAEQRAQAPKLQLSSEVVGIAFEGKKKKTAVVEVQNNGLTELNISSLQLFTPGLEVSLGRRQLAPGKKTKLKITAIRDELKKIKVRPRILMITNDPAKPKVTITIHAK
jgi:hypothetical protein